ncbi:hypothetical protein N7456_000730 [Penicillium angulare]|uniref:Uncharacterized protein n=1 Tax=Penicillium angulare TaxID=116970 RepID=A0A9W9GCQ8_9EURO|nr:hypothetical protein N7456_000730 [Penicillium angulare]
MGDSGEETSGVGILDRIDSSPKAGNVGPHGGCRNDTSRPGHVLKVPAPNVKVTKQRIDKLMPVISGLQPDSSH